MSDILLYIAPGSCSRVPLIALLEAGAAFETTVVRFLKGEHKSPDYKRINPKGKVPALVIGDEALTENVAIIGFLNGRFPKAGLLPPAATPMDQAHQIADLCFCSATLHPLVTRIVVPQVFAAPANAAEVAERGVTAMREFFQLIDSRLAAAPWWYGELWSAMDIYLNWVFRRVEGVNFPVGDYPNFAAHDRRMTARPAFARAMEIEAAATAVLEAEGLAFTPSPRPA